MATGAWWKEPTAGAAAGLLPSAVLHPVDTLRARLDMGYGTVGGPTSVGGGGTGVSGSVRALARVARSTWVSEGMRGLFGGYQVVLIGSGPASALYFGGYRWLSRLGEGKPGLAGSDALAGFGAEVLALLVYTPLDVAKQRLQVAPAGTTAGAMVRALLRERGAAGLWSGYWAGLVVWGPYSALYFGVYEAVKRAGNNFASGVGGSGSGSGSGSGDASEPVGDRPVFSAVEFLAGATGGAAGAVATQPLDCVKTRMQVGAQERSLVLGPPGRVQPVPAGLGLARTLSAIVANEGTAALWRGAAARAIWLAPGAGITISLFEAFYRVLDDGRPGHSSGVGDSDAVT